MNSVEEKDKLSKNNEACILLCPNCLNRIPLISLEYITFSEILYFKCQCQKEEKGIYFYEYKTILEKVVDLSNVIISCARHNKSYSYYCQHCDLDLCDQCLKDHEGHKLKSLNQVLDCSLSNISNKVKEIATQNKKLIYELIAKMKEISNKDENDDDGYVNLNEDDDEEDSFDDDDDDDEEEDIMQIERDKITKEFSYFCNHDETIKTIFNMIESTLKFTKNNPMYATTQLLNRLVFQSKIINPELPFQESINEVKEYLGHLLMLNNPAIEEIVKRPIQKLKPKLITRRIFDYTTTRYGYSARPVLNENMLKVLGNSFLKKNKDPKLEKYVMRLQNSLFVKYDDDFLIFYDRYFEQKITIIELEKNIDYLLQLSNENLCGIENRHAIVIKDIKNFQTLYSSGLLIEILSNIIEFKDNTIACCANKVIKHWSNTLQLIGEFIGHSDKVNRVIQLYDGKYASCSQDKTIRIWDKYTEVGLLMNKEYNSESIIQIKDGRLLSLDESGYICLWSLTTNRFLNILLYENNRSLVNLQNGRFAVDYLCEIDDKYHGAFAVFGDDYMTSNHDCLRNYNILIYSFEYD